SGSAGPGRINAGVYLLAKDLLEGMGLPEAFSFERDVLAPKVRELRPAAFPARGMFIDIGIPGDYARAHQIFSSPRPPGLPCSGLGIACSPWFAPRPTGTW